MIANRHDQDAGILGMCRQFAAMAKNHLDALKSFFDKYGKDNDESPDRLRSALFQGPRLGGKGQIMDLQDLSMLVHKANGIWIDINQCAKYMNDQGLVQLCDLAEKELNQQIAWIKTQVKNTVVQALLVEETPSSKINSSIPKKISPAVISDNIWSPFIAGSIALIIGSISIFANIPFLIPSLGPTAYLQAVSPAHPSSKIYNVVVGHVIGLGSGIIGVLLMHALNAPVVTMDSSLTIARLWAAVIALFLTVLLCLLFKADHPPAAATTLLVSLGLIKNLDHYTVLLVGVLIIGVIGEVFRLIRLKGISKKE
jgi:hypothetical protein